MITEFRILGGVIDHNYFVELPHLVAERGLDFKLATGGQTKMDVVQNLAGDPTVLSHPRDRGESHPRRSTHDIKNRRHSRNSLDGSNVGRKIIFQAVVLPLATSMLLTSSRHAK